VERHLVFVCVVLLNGVHYLFLYLSVITYIGLSSVCP
jgi:hypothetical protein